MRNKSKSTDMNDKSIGNCVANTGKPTYETPVAEDYAPSTESSFEWSHRRASVPIQESMDVAGDVNGPGRFHYTGEKQI